MTNTWMIVKVLAAPATDVCLWERPAFKVILKASQRVFEFPRHWGTICPTCEERARTPLTKWLFSGAESYFYGSKGPVIHFPIYFFFNMAIPWKSNSSVTETEHEPCVLRLSKPYSKCSVSASVRSCQLIPVSKENYLILWHTCLSLIVGTVTTDPLITFFHPASLLLHSCLAPAVLYHRLWLLIPTFSLAPCSLTRHLSLYSLFLPWVIISSKFPQSSNKVQNSKWETCWGKQPQSASD